MQIPITIETPSLGFILRTPPGSTSDAALCPQLVRKQRARIGLKGCFNAGK